MGGTRHLTSGRTTSLQMGLAVFQKPNTSPSPKVQNSPSLQGSPSFVGEEVHSPVAGSQEPLEHSPSLLEQSTGTTMSQALDVSLQKRSFSHLSCVGHPLVTPSPHTPLVQASLMVQNRPSLQEVPSVLGCFLHLPASKGDETRRTHFVRVPAKLLLRAVITRGSNVV